MPCPRPRALRPRWCALAALLLAPAALPAQAGSIVLPTSPVEDASVAKRGEVRAGVSTSWTRWNELIGPSSLRQRLGSAFTSDTFGTQLAGIASAQYLLRQLTGDQSLSLSAGRVTTNAAQRAVVTPITLEYGLTSRLQLSASVPIVQTRIDIASIVDSTVNTTGGLNPALQSASQRTIDSLVVAQLSSAAQALQQRIASCDANPSQNGCGAIVADRDAAVRLVTNTSTAAFTIAYVYGTGGLPGQMLVPLAQGAVQQAVAQSLTRLDQQLAAYLGSSYVTARPVGAAGVIGARDLTTLLASAGDTVASFSRIGIGDVGFALKFLAWDGWSGVPAGAFRGRVALSAGVRLGTGIPGRSGVLYDVGTGDGHTAIEGAVFSDLLALDRYGLSGALRYTRRGAKVSTTGSGTLLDLFGTPFGLTVPSSRTLGDVTQLEFQPFVLVGRALSLLGRYTLMHQAPDRLDYTAPPIADVLYLPGAPSAMPQPEAITAQRLGLGVSYSTIAAATPGHPPRWPLEVTFSHEETVSASGGVTPKLRRDQIAIRLRYQLLRRRAQVR